MLKRGITYVHEHITIDLSSIKQNDDCNFNNKEQVIKELKKLYNSGVRNIIDVTCTGMKQNVEYVNEVSKKTKLNIVQSTGFYQEKFMVDFVKENAIENIAQKMINDIEFGIKGTETKAQLIAEIATSKDEITENEMKVFMAACIAHHKTGVPISTHTTLGTMGLEQVAIFQENNVNLKKVVIGHVDLSGDVNYIKKLCKTGVNVAFDTIGKENYQPDVLRIEMLKELIASGYEEQIVLSMDITRKSNLEDQGGIGYGYLITTFKKMMNDNGITNSVIEKMLISNPLRIFGQKEG